MRVVDLFSGCGGLSLGFQNAGFEVIAAYEFWDRAVDIYNKNFDHEAIQYDLSAVEDYSEFTRHNPDIIIGGPPCQDYSSAGKRKEDKNSNLTIDFADIVSNVKPKYFVMENVDQIKKYDAFERACKIFKEAGYGLSGKVLDASYCGVPQKRKRFFLFGELGGQDNALIPYFEKNMTDKPMTIRDFLGDSLGVDYYYRHPRNYNRRGVFSVDEPSPTIRGVNRPVPAGYKRHHLDKLGPDEVRPLTTKERSMLQTFPAEFILDEAKTHAEQMVGNAVPPKLAEFVGKAILEYLADDKPVEVNEQIDIFSLV